MEPVPADWWRAYMATQPDGTTRLLYGPNQLSEFATPERGAMDTPSSFQSSSSSSSSPKKVVSKKRPEPIVVLSSESPETKRSTVDPMTQLRRLLEAARGRCRVFSRDSTSAEITRSLNEIGVAIIGMPELGIERQIGNLVADTFTPSDETENKGFSNAALAALRVGNFKLADQEWTKSVANTGMALRDFRMPQRLPMFKGAHGHFTDTMTKTIHLKNPMLALAPLLVWEQLPAALQPSTWFQPPLRPENLSRILCNEDGIKFVNHRTYNPTPLHYDGQPERVQCVYTQDRGRVRLFAVPGSGTPQAQALISQILGVELTEEFATHKTAFDANPKVRALLEEFGVAVPHYGILAFRTRVWHFEGKMRKSLDEDLGLAFPKSPQNYEKAKTATSQADILRVYCGVTSLPNDEDMVRKLIRHAFLRQHNWPMEAFAHDNRKRGKGIFVAEKSSVDPKNRSNYDALRPQWQALQNTSLKEMKRFLFENCDEFRLGLYGLSVDDLLSDE